MCKMSTSGGSRSKGGVRSSEKLIQSRPDHVKSRASVIRWTRILLSLSLLVLAAALGSAVHFFFTRKEKDLARRQFQSIAGRATAYARQTTQLKRLGVMTMATMIGVAHPNADDWPFVLVDGYDDIATRLVQTISGDGMGFAPIVSPDQLASFESFAYDSYHNKLGYPKNTTAVSSFGGGVWGKDYTGEVDVEARDKKYHEGSVHPDGGTTYGSPHHIFTPVLQHSRGPNARPLMFNLHSEKIRGRTIDSIINCTDTSSTAPAEKGGKEEDIECGQITDLLLLTQRRAPAALFMQPIFPSRNSSKITGIIASPLVWHDVLSDAFGNQVDGIHCVLTSSTGITYTYYVEGGDVSLKGEGDYHETDFEEYEEEVVLTDEKSGLYSEFSASYTLRLYPTEEFMETYRTDNPMWGTIISVFIISLTTVMFCLYDCNVRGEFTFKNELLEAKRSFIRFVSHEVRTPLNAVYMGLTLMREQLENAVSDSKKAAADVGGDDDNLPPASLDKISEWKGVTDEVLGNAQNAVDVLNDLLNYDKITTGSLELELSLLEANYLMYHAEKEFKLQAAKKKISVVFEDNASPPRQMKSLCIIGDEVRLIQVLRNLMSNALKFTPPEGSVKVSLAWGHQLPDSKKARKSEKEQHLKLGKEQKFTLKKGEEVSFSPCGFFQLSVADNGAGMSEDQISNVFEQGTQFNVNELQAGQGSGLGLYIAKGIMDQHLGSLTVSSEGLGKGTVFTMHLPVYHNDKRKDEDPVPEIDPFHFKAAKPSAGPQQGGTNLRILVVDDSGTNRKFLTRILQNHGHTCDQARDGSEAVEMIAKSKEKGGCSDDGSGNDEKHYDAVLLDYEMPVMNGPTAAKKMRNLGSDTFIVGITGNLLPEDIEYFRSQGANEVLPKPFNISDLEEILMEYGVGFRGK